jgi:hypothetical protein
MRDWVIDIVAAVAWLGGLVLVIAEADALSGEIAIPLLIAICLGLGFVSGRYRILLVPVAIASLSTLVVLIFDPGGDCRPSEGCEDDVATWFWIAWTVFWTGAVELAIWAGVLVRRATLGRPGDRPTA